MKFTWSERFAVWVLRFIPRFIAESPERFVINVACVLIGLTTVLVDPLSGGLVDRWNDWLRYEWGVAMIAGGLATLFGSPSRRWALERLGLLLLAVATSFFATNLLLVFGLRHLFTALIFYGITLAKMVRFTTSSVVRARLLHPPPHPPPHPPADDQGG